MCFRSLIFLLSWWFHDKACLVILLFGFSAQLATLRNFAANFVYPTLPVFRMINYKSLDRLSGSIPIEVKYPTHAIVDHLSLTPYSRVGQQTL